MESRAEVRAGDRSDSDHHSAREEIARRDHWNRLHAGQDHDRQRVEKLGCDQRSAIADAVGHDAPQPFEREHAEAEHRKCQSDLTRTRSELPQLEWQTDQQ